MLTFYIEPLKWCWIEVMALAEKHWQETEGYRHNQPFAPSFERYNACNESGWFVMYTARADGVLVGYAGMYITQSMHTQEIIAVEDTFFLLPEYRKGRNGIRLAQFVEEDCRKRGVVEIQMTAKMTNGAGRILEYLDYQQVAIQYSKRLARADSALTKESQDVCAIAAAST